MKKLFILSILFPLIFVSCTEEPDPEPEAIRAYCYLYHFIPGLENVNWIVGEYEIPDNHYYSSVFPAAVTLESSSEETEFTVKHAGTGTVLGSRSFTLEENKYYNVIITGEELDPVLLIQEVETTRPMSGMVKFQFLHAGIFTDSIDVFMGGATPEKKAVSGLNFKELTAPFEVNDYDARALINVTVHDEEFNQDNVLLTSVYNEMVHSQASYLMVLAPFTIDPESKLTLMLYDLPIEY